MIEHSDRHKQVTRWLRWGARLWSLPIIAYALLMFTGYAWNWVTTGLADPYAVENVPFRETLPPIFMFLSIVGLGIAWRWERWGGTITIVFELVVLVLLLIDRPITRDFPRFAIPYVMALIATIPGVVFLICWRRSRQA